MQPAGCPAGRPAVGTHTTAYRNQHPGETLPRSAPDYRRAATRVKDASGAAMRPGSARSLTRALCSHEHGTCAGKGEPTGQSATPCKPCTTPETAGRNPLDTGPLLQG